MRAFVGIKSSGLSIVSHHLQSGAWFPVHDFVGDRLHDRLRILKFEDERSAMTRVFSNALGRDRVGWKNLITLLHPARGTVVPGHSRLTHDRHCNAQFVAYGKNLGIESIGCA